MNVLKIEKVKPEKLVIKTEIVKRYYVEYPGKGGIYGGPFDSKQEAQACLDEAKEMGYSR